jgi:hypothetical protein
MPKKLFSTPLYLAPLIEFGAHFVLRNMDPMIWRRQCFVCLRCKNLIKFEFMKFRPVPVDEYCILIFPSLNNNCTLSSITPKANLFGSFKKDGGERWA